MTIKKLNLSMETVRVLSDAELDRVDGGGTATIVKTAVNASKKYCKPVAGWVTANVCVPVSLEYCTTILPKKKDQ